MDEDQPIVPPPSNVIVPEPDKRPVLYDYMERPLVRPPIGFNTVKFRNDSTIR